MCLLGFHIANNKGTDQTERMHRLVCSFVIGKQQSFGFSRRDQDMMLKPMLPGLPQAIRLNNVIIVQRWTGRKSEVDLAFTTQNELSVRLLDHIQY